MANAPGGLSEQQVSQVKTMLQAAAAGPDWTDGLDAISDFFAKAAWPLIAALLLWRLYPALKAIVSSRAFTIKIGSMEVTVPEQTASLTAQVEDLREQVIALRGGVAPGAAAAPPAAPATTTETAPPPGRILWVDDTMANNASEIAQLTETAVKVIQSPSAPDAMAILRNSPPFDAVISDMGRREGGRYHSRAGLELLGEIRAAGRQEPFMIYTTKRLAADYGAQVRAAGGDGATGSAVELIEWIRSKVPAATPPPAAEPPRPAPRRSAPAARPRG